MKHLVIVGDYFEDVECIAMIDVLKRGGEEVTLASMMGRKELRTKCGFILVADDVIENVNPASYDSLIIPGGPGSFKILAFMPKVTELIHAFAGAGKLVAAICAAPMLVGRLGYYKDMTYTVHPGFEGNIIGGTYLRDQGVVVHEHFIMGKSMYYSIPFGLAIYAHYHGQYAADKLERSCQGEQ